MFGLVDGGEVLLLGLGLSDFLVLVDGGVVVGWSVVGGEVFCGGVLVGPVVGVEECLLWLRGLRRSWVEFAGLFVGVDVLVGLRELVRVGGGLLSVLPPGDRVGVLEGERLRVELVGVPSDGGGLLFEGSLAWYDFAEFGDGLRVLVGRAEAFLVRVEFFVGLCARAGLDGVAVVDGGLVRVFEDVGGLGFGEEE